MQLIDARQFFVKMRKSLGNKRNKLGDADEGEPDQIGEITRIYGNFQDGETRTFTDRTVAEQKTRCVVSKVFDNADFGFHKITVERPLRLNFQADRRAHRPPGGGERLPQPRHQQQANETARHEEIAVGKQRQEAIRGSSRLRRESTAAQLYNDREAFLTDATRAVDRLPASA